MQFYSLYFSLTSIFLLHTFLKAIKTQSLNAFICAINMLDDAGIWGEKNDLQNRKVNVSLSGECVTPHWASHILPSRVTPANINICFSFQVAVALCSGGVKEGGEPKCGECDLQTGYYSD